MISIPLIATEASGIESVISNSHFPSPISFPSSKAGLWTGSYSYVAPFGNVHKTVADKCLLIYALSEVRLIYHIVSCNTARGNLTVQDRQNQAPGSLPPGGSSPSEIPSSLSKVLLFMDLVTHPSWGVSANLKLVIPNILRKYFYLLAFLEANNSQYSEFVLHLWE